MNHHSSKYTRVEAVFLGELSLFQSEFSKHEST